MGFRWLDFKITNRCNNKCIYCGQQDPPSACEIVPGQDISKALNDALGLGYTHFALLGGEPSIREDFEHLVKPLQKEGSSQVESVMVISNMLNFNEKMYRSIFQANAKHAQIVASVDNLKEPNYKNQNIPQILNSIERIQDISREYAYLGIREVHVHTVISRENFTNLVDHISFFKLKDIEVSMALVEPFEIVEKPQKYNQFTNRDVDNILEQLNKLEDMDLLNWSNDVLREYIDQYSNLEGKSFRECSAGNKHIIIDSDGSVYPCLTNAYKKRLKYGNIIKDTLTDIHDCLENFECELLFQQTCWDHFLWSKLEKLWGGDTS